VLGGSGPKNYFGDESDGDIRITAVGAEQSVNDGVTWSAIPGWTKVGNTVMVPSVQDGDMVVVNARSLTIDSGYTMTVTKRCRGLLIYCLTTCTIDGTVSMTARGCHANPEDTTITAATPVLPSDGHAVPADGMTIRRLAKDYTDADDDVDLMYGCGSAAVEAEANQPPVSGDGIVIRIPKVGGSGGSSKTSAPGSIGGTMGNAPGGGGSGGAPNSNRSGAGAAGTCWSGGSGGGGGPYSPSSGTPNWQNEIDGVSYGGRGGNLPESLTYDCSGGSGNPAGVYPPNPTAMAAAKGGEGTGGLLIVIIGGDLAVGSSGSLVANGVNGARNAASGLIAAGGGSGGGCIAVLHAGAINIQNIMTANGGLGGLATTGVMHGGAGGAGAVIGPIKIDSA
jgi:hypothetical protein